jgi:Esterase-like activity of phytase
MALANPHQTKVAVSEITAVSNTTFLVDELDGEPQPKGNKKIYLADISAATDVGPRAKVSGTTYQADARGLLINGAPIETFIGVSGVSGADEATGKLSAAGIKVAGKSSSLISPICCVRCPSTATSSETPKSKASSHRTAQRRYSLSTTVISGFPAWLPILRPFRSSPRSCPTARRTAARFFRVDTKKLPPTMESETVPIKVG